MAKRTRWGGVPRKIRTTEAPARLEEVTGVIAQFLLPLVGALRDGKRFDMRWMPGESGEPAGA